MPDRDKVIKGLEILMNGCEYIHCDDCCFYISAKPTRCGLREEQIQEDALSLLKEQPELIRCKDCKYFHEFEPSEICKRTFHDETSYECWNPRLTDQDNVPTKGPDWFCADGERGERDAYDNSKR